MVAKERTCLPIDMYLSDLNPVVLHTTRLGFHQSGSTILIGQTTLLNSVNVNTCV